jgi:hypothetical protein
MLICLIAYEYLDGVRELSSEQPEPAIEPEEPVAPEPAAPEPPAPEPAPPEVVPEEEAPAPPPPEEVKEPEDWAEEFEKETQQEKKPKKKRHWGSLIVLVIVVLFLVIWTLLSPSVLPEAGPTYIYSDTYANLGHFTGERDIWWLGSAIHVGNTTWGLSIGGDDNGTVNAPPTISVMVSKVDEGAGNWWFRGTAIKLSNVSLFLEDGTYVASMDTRTEGTFGPVGEIHPDFGAVGNYTCYVYVRFTVYEAMRIGYIPLETVDMTADLEIPIEITAS